MSLENIQEIMAEERSLAPDASTLERWKKEWKDLLKWQKSPEAARERRKNEQEMAKFEKIKAREEAKGNQVMFASTVTTNFGEQDVYQLMEELWNKGFDSYLETLSKPVYYERTEILDSSVPQNVALIYYKRLPTS